jgi:hypothetical protein
MKPAEDGRRYDATRVLDGSTDRSGAGSRAATRARSHTAALLASNASPFRFEAQSLFQTENPGDFHSTGASYVPRKDSRGTKPARITL